MATGTSSGSTTIRAAEFITPDDPGKDLLGTPQHGRIDMASSGKKKTTMAKLTRESRLRERRLDKQAKKDARKQAPVHHTDRPGDTLNATTGESADRG
jgi:hypothetical protein